MDKTLYARLNLNECTVVGNEDNFTLNLVTNLEVRIKSIPRMSLELLQTESDSLLVLIEIEDNDIDLLVEGNNLLRMVDSAPGEVCDVDETVNTAEVHEYSVVGDVLDSTLKYLTFLELADDFCLLGFDFSLDESFV